jgi:hypothetical protein
MNTNFPCYKLSRYIVQEHAIVDNIRLETSPTEFLVLSYHHLNVTKFESAESRDVITMSFLNRTVHIAGTNLRDLAIAIQDRCVVSINLLADRYASVAGNDARVKSIEIVTSEEE